MPTRITPIDVQLYADKDTYKKGETLYDKKAVKHRFQSNYGLQATVRDKSRFRVEMIIEGEQLFGRCTCPSGTRACEHQVATLLAWVSEPRSFISYQQLRKAIRQQDKNSLIDLLMSLSEVFPEISQFFVSIPGKTGRQSIQQEIADIFNHSSAKTGLSTDVIDSTQIILIRARYLRTKGEWVLARTIYFETLIRLLDLTDSTGSAKPFSESFVAEMADNFEECSVHDPNFELNKKDILKETQKILDHPSAENEGVFLEDLKARLEL